MKLVPSRINLYFFSIGTWRIHRLLKQFGSFGGGGLLFAYKGDCFCRFTCKSELTEGKNEFAKLHESHTAYGWKNVDVKLPAGHE